MLDRTTPRWPGASARRRGALLACAAVCAALGAWAQAQESAESGGPAESAESAEGPRIVAVSDVILRPNRYEGLEIRLLGVVEDPSFARSPEGLQMDWALAGLEGEQSLCLGVIGEPVPALHEYVDVRGVVHVDDLDPIPYLEDPVVTIPQELPMWKRPYDRETLAAAGAILAGLTGLLLLYAALSASARRVPEVSPEAFERALARVPVTAVDAPPAEAEAEPAGAPLTLEVRTGPDAGRTFTTSRRLVTIGRRSDRDVALTDRTVARFEASLIRNGERAIVRAENPHATITVNGHAVTEALFTPGDVLKVGETELCALPADERGHTPVEP